MNDGDGGDDDVCVLFFYQSVYPHHSPEYTNLYSSNQHSIPIPYDQAFHTTLSTK